MTSSLVRRDPFAHLLGGLDHEFRRLLAPTPTSAWLPALDVSEHEHEIVVRMDVPGLDADQVSIELRDGLLTVSGERVHEASSSKGFYQAERYIGRFSRAVRVPPAVVNADGISASLDRGVLSITLPKSEAARPRRIEIARSDSTPKQLDTSVETGTETATTPEAATGE